MRCTDRQLTFLLLFSRAVFLAQQIIMRFQPWASGMPGGGASGGQAGWGHMSPQQMRNPWQDPNALGMVFILFSFLCFYYC